MRDKILKEVLITGANGMVGSYIDFGTKLDRRALDVVDLNNVLDICKKYKPKIIIHLAAETDVGFCERDPQHAYTVNTIGTYNMVVAAKEIGAKFIYISTSAVFDGSKGKPYVETDEPNPQSYYGRSKFLGEIIVKNVLDNYIIGRVCWMFGGGPSKDQKFVAKIIGQTIESEIKVIRDKYGSPTYAKDLINALKKMIINNKKGVFHMSNIGTPSRFDVAKEIVKITNSETKVTEVDQKFFNSINSENMPNNDDESMLSKVNIMRPWRQALKEYIEKEWKSFIRK